jgi:hypothetical protein
MTFSLQDIPVSADKTIWTSNKPKEIILLCDEAGTDADCWLVCDNAVQEERYRWQASAQNHKKKIQFMDIPFKTGTHFLSN